MESKLLQKAMHMKRLYGYNNHSYNLLKKYTSDENLLIASLVYELSLDKHLSIEKIYREFNPEVARLVATTHVTYPTKECIELLNDNEKMLYIAKSMTEQANSNDVLDEDKYRYIYNIIKNSYCKSIPSILSDFKINMDLKFKKSVEEFATEEEIYKHNLHYFEKLQILNDDVEELKEHLKNKKYNGPLMIEIFSAPYLKVDESIDKIVELFKTLGISTKKYMNDISSEEKYTNYLKTIDDNTQIVILRNGPEHKKSEILLQHNASYEDLAKQTDDLYAVNDFKKTHGIVTIGLYDTKDSYLNYYVNNILYMDKSLIYKARAIDEYNGHFLAMFSFLDDALNPVIRYDKTNKFLDIYLATTAVDLAYKAHKDLNNRYYDDDIKIFKK